VLVTVGTLIILSDLAAVLAGPDQRNILTPSDSLEFGQVIVSTVQLYVLAGISVLTFAIHLLLKRSWFGKAVRAATQDPVGAAICGVRSATIHALTFAFGSALVAVAGVLYALSFPVDPYMGFGLTVKAFTIIVVGGIGNLVGALLAALLLGVAEAFTAFYWAPQWAPALSIIILLVILVVFPRGIAAGPAA
jgi:branched-chain amino acid transport system permease protein